MWITLSKFFVSLRLGSANALTGLESEFSRMMYIKYLDSDRDQVNHESMVTTQV